MKLLLKQALGPSMDVPMLSSETELMVSGGGEPTVYCVAVMLRDENDQVLPVLRQLHQRRCKGELSQRTGRKT